MRRFYTPHPPQAATSPTRGEVILNPKLFPAFVISRTVQNRHGATSPLVGEVARSAGEGSYLASHNAIFISKS